MLEIFYDSSYIQKILTVMLQKFRIIFAIQIIIALN